MKRLTTSLVAALLAMACGGESDDSEQLRRSVNALNDENTAHRDACEQADTRQQMTRELDRHAAATDPLFERMDTATGEGGHCQGMGNFRGMMTDARDLEEAHRTEMRDAADVQAAQNICDAYTLEMGNRLALMGDEIDTGHMHCM